MRFFKPTLAKILLTIALGSFLSYWIILELLNLDIIELGISIVTALATPQGGPPLEECGTGQDFYKIPQKLCDGPSTGSLALYTIPYLIVITLISYIISCLVFSLLDKSKKRKK